MNQLRSVLTSLFKPLIEPEVYTNSAAKLAMVIIYILVGLIVIGIINKAIEKAFKFQNKSNRGNKKRSKTLVSFIENIVRYIVWFIVLTTVLSKFRTNVNGIIASASVVGIAVGSGAQTIVRDTITGFFIILENQFDVGDYVKINSGGTTTAEGTVKSTGLRPTRINTITGELIILPNGSMGEIINYSITNGTSIVEIPVSVDEGLDKVGKKLSKSFTAMRSKYYLSITDPAVLGTDGLGETKVIIRISAETTLGEGVSGSRTLRKEIQKMFVQEGIRLPRPMYARNTDKQDA